ALQRLDALTGRNAEMEADDRGLLVEEDGEHVVVNEEAWVALLQRSRRRGAEAREVRAQALDPPRFTGVVGARRRVAEDVHVQRATRPRAKRGDHLARARGVRRAESERAERTRVRDRSRHLRRRYAGHRRLHDRHIDLQELLQPLHAARSSTLSWLYRPFGANSDKRMRECASRSASPPSAGARTAGSFTTKSCFFASAIKCSPGASPSAIGA